MIDDDLLAEYMVLARVPADQFDYQRRVRDFCAANRTAAQRGRSFVLWFEVERDEIAGIQAGILPVSAKGGPIFYGWAMLSFGDFAKDVRKIIEASGCTTLVMDRWRK